MLPIAAENLYGFHKQQRVFRDALSSSKLHHAWLFTGEMGIGKATLAYTLAKQLIGKPQKIIAGSHPDFLAIDAWYNEGESRKKPTISVDQVRKLNSFMQMTAAEADRKVAVIDGVEYMTIGAANALLKVLEEPPLGNVILLICHALHKILPTIRSRCLLLKCHPHNFEDYYNALRITLPMLDWHDAERLYDFCGGNIGFSLQLHAAGGIKLADDLRELALTGGDLRELMQFFDQWTLDAERWDLMKNITMKALIDHIKSHPLQSERALSKLREVQNFFAEVDLFNLDKQHAMIHLSGIPI